MMTFSELRRKILEDMLGTSYDAYINFKKEPMVPKKRQHRKRIPLWRFLLHLLYLDSASSLVQWIDMDDLTFKIKQPVNVAELWGSIKDKSDMTYEKLGRAMRYYYGKNVIEKVCGLRYTYRFIVSRKTKRHLDKLVARRPSTDSETTTESDSVYSSEVDDFNGHVHSQPVSPSSFFNDDFSSLLSSDILFQDNPDLIIAPEKDDFMRIDTIALSSSEEDNCLALTQESFMDLEELQFSRKGRHIENLDLRLDTISNHEKTDHIFRSANPVDVFFSGNMDTYDCKQMKLRFDDI